MFRKQSVILFVLIFSTYFQNDEHDDIMDYGGVNGDHRRTDFPHSRSPQERVSDVGETKVGMGGNRDSNNGGVSPQRHRFPHSIVWTPIPCLSWLFPFIGHMGIALSSGVIRDFAGSYYVSEDEMAFGWPTIYWQLNLDKVVGGAANWDKAVLEASDEYKHHAHNLLCDNCHSHVALALNTMNYDNSRRWNMVKLAAQILFRGRYVGVGGFLKHWLPFLFIVTLITVLVVVLPMVSRR